MNIGKRKKKMWYGQNTSWKIIIELRGLRARKPDKKPSFDQSVYKTHKAQWKDSSDVVVNWRAAWTDVVRFWSTTLEMSFVLFSSFSVNCDWVEFGHHTAGQYYCMTQKNSFFNVELFSLFMSLEKKIFVVLIAESVWKGFFWYPRESQRVYDYTGHLSIEAGFFSLNKERAFDIICPAHSGCRFILLIKPRIIDCNISLQLKSSYSLYIWFRRMELFNSQIYTYVSHYGVWSILCILKKKTVMVM